MSLREPFVLALVFASISLSACAAPPLGAGEEADSAEEEDEEHEAEPQFIASGRTGVSCAERSVTGYDRGKAYGMKVITVSGKATAKATAHAFLKLQAAAEAAGVSLGINSGFRSMQEQQHRDLIRKKEYLRRADESCRAVLHQCRAAGGYLGPLPY